MVEQKYDVGAFSVVEGEEHYMLKFNMRCVHEVPWWTSGLHMDGIVIRTQAFKALHVLNIAFL